MLKSSSVTSIITVNFRTADLTINSLHSLSSQIEVLNGGKVIIVDNCSEDGSVEKIQSVINEESWTWAQVLPAARNGGFAYGNNLGFKHAMSQQKTDYLMLLNPDTLVRKDALINIISFMDSHSNVGVAGSRLENSNGEVVCSAHTFPSPVSELLDSARLNVLTKLLIQYQVTPKLRNEAHQADWVSGSSMVINTKVFDDVQFFDENFFLYFEEVDFFQRLAKTNWQVWYVPESIVMHIEGAATGINKIKRRPTYWFYSRRRYFIKHFGILGLLLADFFWVLGIVSFKLRRFLHIASPSNHAKVPFLTFDILRDDLKALLSGAAWALDQEKNK
jgi:GT2 family glycosyltransferase